MDIVEGRVFPNPFYYEPDALCRQAMAVLQAYLGENPDQTFAKERVPAAFQEEIAHGKMFGVLVVALPSTTNHQLSTSLHQLSTNNLRLAFLAGYSGQICGRSDWSGFVPAVFDYLQPNGYFKTHEAEITGINHEIEALANSQEYHQALAALKTANQQAQQEIDAYKTLMHQAKALRDKQRASGNCDEAVLLKESKFQKAELHRLKKRWATRIAEAETAVQTIEDRLASRKRLRRQKSDDLQRWLFSHFRMLNARGESHDLLQIWQDWSEWDREHNRKDTGISDYPMGRNYSPSHGEARGRGQEGEAIPPAGAGECCEPKLLQYAFSHGLRPVSMAMFWWGDSPKEEVRHHLHCYPACRSKCRPILHWMLQGMNVAPNPLEEERHDMLEILYEDDAICVVNKPAGMLAVTGKTKRESVESIMRRRYPKAHSPLIVHRLDMSTSGLMVIALTMEAYHVLQQQFITRAVQKRYVAILDHEPPTKCGHISLPLAPDITDRPRQLVDPVNGRPAETDYEVVEGCRVHLWPRTGRTHQLRVHCAHRDGLNVPIVGDDLYGQRADRLYLHAEQITFRHPVTHELVTFTAPCPF